MNNKIVKDENCSLVLECGKPFNVDIALNTKYDFVNIAIGYYLKGGDNDERNVAIYEDYYDIEKLSIDGILDENLPPTYKGPLVKINWFLTIEAGEQTETLPVTVYPQNYFKYTEGKN